MTYPTFGPVHFFGGAFASLSEIVDQVDERFHHFG
jgi:hypothetical protein